jgi:histidyl-tRNA synthetase
MSAAEAAGCVTPDIARQYLRLLDKKDKLPPETYRAQLAAILPRDPMDVVEKDTKGPVAERRDAVKAFIEDVKKWGVSNIVFDPTLARGFDYYTGIVFEIFDTNPENPRALFGGGRYDGLVSLFGGEAVPAVGFAFGDVTFHDFLATHDLLPAPNAAPDIYLGTAGEEFVPAAQMAGMNLRKQGVKTWVNLRKRKLFDQIDEARERGIPFFALIGEAEAGSLALRLQPLRDELGRKDDEKWQRSYRIEEAARVMKDALAPARA